MRLILVGCEYSGTRTLAKAIIAWAKETMDGFAGTPDEYLVHDHFMIPHISHPPDLTDEEHEQIMALRPRVKEMIQRHNIYYHIPFAAHRGDSMLIGLHIADNVYGPLYFGYLVDPDPDDPIMATRGMFEEWINLVRARDGPGSRQSHTRGNTQANGGEAPREASAAIRRHRSCSAEIRGGVRGLQAPQQNDHRHQRGYRQAVDARVRPQD